jgi:hypothetical protein
MTYYVGDDDEFQYEGDGGEQIIGEDQIIGDDLMSVFGSDPRIMSQLRKIALARAANGAAVRRKPRDTVYQQPIPIPVTAVTAVSPTADITITPQRLVRVERLVIPSTIAPFFRITQLNVGQEPQFVSAGAIPATVFSEVAVGVRLKGDTANLGNTITLSVANTSGADQTFEGCILGTVLN